MSMLAEPRRKQRWSVDPRNSAWSKDDSKFGQKMLERMGWSKGKGLGRSEQGSTDHIRVKLKNDNYGLGANASHEDNWIAHQDDFNELLAQLNNHHGQNASTELPPDEKKGFSLEEKSKLSRKRVHYTKFTKGKDLSSRTETDLNCIFGKRARPARDQEQESNSCDSRSSDAEGISTPTASELDTESITKTVTSTLTMQEYFAQRMSRLKAARGQAQSPAPTAEENNGTSHPSEEPSPNHSVNGDAEEPKKKKKKKKSKKVTDQLEGTIENTSIPSVTEEDGGQQQEHLGKKKKKRKTVENEDGINENCSATSVVEQNCEEPPLSKRKKKHKKHKETEPLNSEEQEFDSEVVHKKNKCRDEVDGVAKDEEQLLRKKCKKDKKKKRQE